MTKTILITGGAGYIGSHAVLALRNAGYEVIVLDNLSNGHRELVEDVLQVKLIVGDMSDRSLLARIFSTHNIDAVMHFAAYIAVGVSVTHPAKYYQNNVIGTLTLLKAMLKGGESEVFNLGNGSGFSVRELIETAKTVTGRKIKIEERDRRPGDPPILVGSSYKARQQLGWQPQYPNLEEIISHAWQWHQKRHI
ncbi:GDP-mannose 4,6-dehydratase [Calothrix sp. NIES-2098]|uniref:GDP-mannose 4,6-dehydratase n=1 Tax=Calothrix sp. NIES-2098 TaxID=1954171 RepID=UPI000B60B9D5|nr:UDP-glucose 4-epimerase [Calothrix sp. NIES-2098]